MDTFLMTLHIKLTTITLSMISINTDTMGMKVIQLKIRNMIIFIRNHFITNHLIMIGTTTQLLIPTSNLFMRIHQMRIIMMIINTEDITINTNLSMELTKINSMKTLRIIQNHLIIHTSQYIMTTLTT